MGFAEQMLLTDFLTEVGGQEAHPGLLSIDFTQNMIRLRVDSEETMNSLPKTYFNPSFNMEFGTEYTIVKQDAPPEPQE